METSAPATAVMSMFAMVVVFGLVACGLWLWSLIHCIINKRLSDSNRVIGIILIVILGLLGSLIYLFLPREAARSGGTSRGYRRTAGGSVNAATGSIRPGTGTTRRGTGTFRPGTASVRAAPATLRPGTSTVRTAVPRSRRR